MLKNYLIIAFRNLIRKKTYSVINIIGLASGIAFCLLVYLYIGHELSFDRFHTNADRLYRLEANSHKPVKKDALEKSLFSFLPAQDEEKNQVVMPVILAPALKESFPEIKQILRLKAGWREIIRYNNQSFREEKVQYADANFFQLFTFPLIQGNPATALASHNSIVITENIAHKYFGRENPIGKTIELASEDTPALFTITAVAENAPVNSSIQFDFVLPIEANPGYKSYIENGLNTSSVFTFVELHKNASRPAFAEKLEKFGRSYFKEWIDGYRKENKTYQASSFHFTTRPFAEAHYNLAYWGHYTSLKNIYQLSCLTLLILIIACLNYLLLTLTNTASRVQEVGLRKVIGAPRWQIVTQFWVETQLLVGMAVIAGWLLAMVLLPYFNQITDTTLDITTAQASGILLALLVTALVVGILAGFYPALFISGIKPLSIIKRHQTFRLRPGLSRTLVVLQYTSCITLLIGALGMASQMKYMNEKNLGFDKEQILVVENSNPGKTGILAERLQSFTNAEPSLADFAATGHTFGFGYDMNMYTIGGKEEVVTVLKVDYNYSKFLGLQVVQGRDFPPQFSTDTSTTERAVVVNETLFKMLGADAKLGEYNQTIRRRIVGVVKDYHYVSVASPIGPAMHQLQPQWAMYFWFKLKPGNIPQTIDKVKNQWNALTGNAPFTYTFLDEDAAKLYESQQRWLKTIYGATLFAMLVACLGLFGLSGIHALNRTKEIGIRKVLGASTGQIFVMLNKDTFWLALISFVIAVPIGYYFMHQWLQDFAYRIHLNWELFAFAGAISACTALLAVSFHSIRAALNNPADSLRDE
ncbi:FtsX-like permease family protein [Rhodocytophaga rosea]|uniref:FtsX-like permease family protein n=1 Tax=Rhodocytophaga rosea TaxID=2704465 RepID=A0A6C0GNQ0_9BACT|nr:ABC transporter permease [Rhodocytophaga rosea]QHT69222.1 FtsX-like permease family protein [Rhodocytophaga rosea]